MNGTVQIIGGVLPFLLVGSGYQPSLLSSWVNWREDFFATFIEELTQAGKKGGLFFAADLLFRTWLKINRWVVVRMAEGVPMRCICNLLELSHFTVKTAVDREPGVVATKKKRRAALWWSGMLMCLEQVHQGFGRANQNCWSWRLHEPVQEAERK